MPNKHLQQVEKIFPLYPENWELLREIMNGPGLSALVPLISKVNLVQDRERRPIRLKIPRELDEAIRSAVDSESKKSEHKYTKVLLEAARNYRELHPYSPDWQEPNQVLYAEAERERRQDEETDLDRKSIVLRLPEDERILLQNLGRGRVGSITRHRALCELAAVVMRMRDSGELEQIRLRRRKSTRVNIPLDLKTAIDARVRNGDKFLTVLMAAAREYRRQHSENPED